MDRLESLGQTLSQITMYDIKSMYTQAKNVVLNISEMEAKVREATNDDPWGASSTLMQEIAQGTFSFQHFNEIMPCIYARFMEKEARQWRQIYKSLQLLEYLIKHGSERVVDDARSHMSTLKMLRNFHYIDDKGKDEGANVRNRSRELVELLSDVEKIRAERRKAKASKHKYTGTGSDGFGLSGMGRYSGFGSDSYSSGGTYGTERSSYRAGSSSFRDDARRPYEEYNAGEDEISPRSQNTSSGRSSQRKASTSAPPPAPVEDLLGGFGDDPGFGSTSNTSSAAGGAAPSKDLPAVSKNAVPSSLDDDDFSDFQAAPATPAVAASVGNNVTRPVTAPVKPTLMEMLNSSPARSTPQLGQNTSAFAQTQPSTMFGASMSSNGPGMVGNTGVGMHRTSMSVSSPQLSSPAMQAQNLFGSPNAVPRTSSMVVGTAMGSLTGASTLLPQRPATSVSGTQTKPSSSSSSGTGAPSFDDLWSMSLGGGSGKGSAAGTMGPGAGKSIKDLEKEKATAGLWGGGGASRPGAAGGASANAAFGGGALGSFGNAAAPLGGGGGSNGDDLLL